MQHFDRGYMISDLIDKKNSSQKVFESWHLINPSGFIGYFAWHFKHSCRKDITNLKALIESTGFERGCYPTDSYKENEEPNAWDTEEKIDYLLLLIDEWGQKKHWPNSVMGVIVGAFFGFIGSSFSNQPISDAVLDDVRHAIQETAGKHAWQKIWNEVCPVLKGANAGMVNLVDSFIFLTIVFTALLLVLELIQVRAQENVFMLRSALELIKRTRYGKKNESAEKDNQNLINQSDDNSHVSEFVITVCKKRNESIKK